MSESEFVTFGCRLNTYESEVMRGHAAKAGLKDAIVFNTCAVTAEATRQARQAIRKAHKVHHKHLGKEHGECFGMLLVPFKYYKEARKALAQQRRG